MGNPSVTTVNKPGQVVQQDVDAANQVVGFKRVTPANPQIQTGSEVKEGARQAGQSLASQESLNEKLESGEWVLVNNSDQLSQVSAGNKLAIAPALDANGQVINSQNNTEAEDGVIASINEAENDLLTPDDGNMALDEEATGLWSGALKSVTDAGKGLFSMIGGLIGDAVPAAKQLVEKTPTKKGNKLATHAGLAAAGLVGLSSVDHLVKAFKSFFGRKDNQVPGLYYLMESLAQGGFTANVFKSAMQGKLNLKNTVYQVAGLLGLKVGENVIDGTAPKILDPFGGNIIKEAAEGVKYFGSASQDAGGGGQGAPAPA